MEEKQGLQSTPNEEVVVETNEAIATEETTEPTSVEAKVYTQEEIDAITKKMQSDSEKGVQKLIKEKKTFERAMDELGKVAEDNTYLVELYESNPDVAKLILDKYYDGKSIEQYKSHIDYKEDITDPEVARRIIDSRVKKELDNKMVDDKKQSFIAKLKMTEEEISDFNETFEELRSLKSFDASNAESFFEKAYRIIDKSTPNESAVKKTEAIANVMATNSGNKEGGSNAKTALDKAREDAKKFAELHKI